MQNLIEKCEAGELENDPDLKEIAKEAKLERQGDKESRDWLLP